LMTGLAIKHMHTVLIPWHIEFILDYIRNVDPEFIGYLISCMLLHGSKNEVTVRVVKHAR
jgi:hypothetical protein